MVETEAHASFRGVADYERARNLIDRINPALLGLPQYARALQASTGEMRREVPFDLIFNGTTIRYEVAVDFDSGQDNPPSKLIIAKYVLTPRGPSFQKDPLAKLQLIAEDCGPHGNRYGYAAVIIGRETTPIERGDQIPLVHQHFAEFLS